MYEKNLNAKKESVKETVRTAEKYLRDARLEEYRKHNSADVNECLTKVEEAMKQPFACGERYANCMDPTGLYINPDTGAPIYSQALFGLNGLIVLNGSSDVLGANKSFESLLDSKKHFAQTALDSCRDIADTVWYEYKRSSIIRIAQAQDDKIQEVKDSCVATIKQCYDKQTGDLASLDSTESQSTGAITAMAARGICYERVQACAALYGDPDGCKYNDKSKKLEAVSGKTCGLQSLLTFVDTVDSVKIAEGCEASLKKYALTLCPDETIDDTTEDGETTVKTLKYGNCKNQDKDQLRAALENHINTFCAPDLVNQDESNTISNNKAYNLNVMNQLVKDIFDSLDLEFTSGCTADGKGEWYGNPLREPEISLLRQDFYQRYYGKTIRTKADVDANKLMERGYCLEKSSVADFETLQETCSMFGGRAVAAEETAEGNKPAMCELPDKYYQSRCCQMGGTYSNGECVIDNWPNSSKTNCPSLF